MVNCATLTVTEQFNPSDVVVQSCALQTESVVPTGQTRVFATIWNGSDSPADVTVQFTVGGQTLPTASGTVDPGNYGQFGTDFTPESVGLTPGDYEVTAELANISQAAPAHQQAQAATVTAKHPDQIRAECGDCNCGGCK